MVMFGEASNGGASRLGIISQGNDRDDLSLELEISKEGKMSMVKRERMNTSEQSRGEDGSRDDTSWVLDIDMTNIIALRGRCSRIKGTTSGARDSMTLSCC
jgi:hypothetical protein